MGRAGKYVDHLARAPRVGVGEAERLAVALVEMGDVVHRLDDEVDGDEVDLRPSTPISGIHWGTVLRSRRISLKK